MRIYFIKQWKYGFSMPRRASVRMRSVGGGRGVIIILALYSESTDIQRFSPRGQYQSSLYQHLQPTALYQQHIYNDLVISAGALLLVLPLPFAFRFTCSLALLFCTLQTTVIRKSWLQPIPIACQMKAHLLNHAEEATSTKPSTWSEMVV